MGFGLSLHGSERVQIGNVGVDVTEGCRDLTIHTVSFFHGRGPVLCTSTPCANEAPEEWRMSGPGEKNRLVSTLWDQLVAMESPLWKHRQSSNKAVLPIQVVCDALGKPHLLLGEYQGPAISFSEGGGKVWAALCGDESDIGIDLAGTDEFQREYPFHRVFHPQELQHALGLAGGDLEKASALLWSIKEAVVKALGCAFHLIDPRQITVCPSVGGDGCYTFPVGLSRKAETRFSIAARGPLWVRSLLQKEMWLSIALLPGLTPVPVRGSPPPPAEPHQQAGTRLAGGKLY